MVVAGYGIMAARSGSGSAAGSATKEPLQVRIPTAVKRRFKAHAAIRGIEPNALFVEIWERYEAGLGHRPAPPEARADDR